MPARWKIVLAFAIIYFVWGSTFLAIRVGVQEVPPFLLASMRFTAAGALVYAWASLRGDAQPKGRQWASTLVLGFVLIVLCYGLLFWAELKVTAGMAAVLAATIPIFMALSEVVIAKTLRFTPGLIGALVLGIAGVGMLVSDSLFPHGAPVDTAGAAALLIGSLSWGVASVMSVRMPLPASGIMRSGSQMLAGGLMLGVVAALAGEFSRFHPAAVTTQTWLALVYLIVAGSIVAFTAYVWLLQHVAPTRVGSYAYVNPVVAVILGYFLLDEPLDARTVTGSLLVLGSVIMIFAVRSRGHRRDT